MCVELALVLMLMIFTILRQKLFVWRAFLQEKKIRLAISQASFFLLVQESSPNKMFLLWNDENSSASA
jgi:hypothetical protein